MCLRKGLYPTLEVKNEPVYAKGAMDPYFNIDTIVSAPLFRILIRDRCEIRDQCEICSASPLGRTHYGEGQGWHVRAKQKAGGQIVM